MADEPHSPHDRQTTTLSKQTRRVPLKHVLLLTIAVALVSFTMGTRSQDLFSWANSSSAPGRLDVSSLQEVYRVLSDKYDGTLDQQKLIDGAKRGLVEAAGDAYSVYLSPAEAKEFQGDLEGTFEGIGAELGKKDDKLVVITTLDNSPAKKAGLAGGDFIAKVNDEASNDWSIEKAVSKIRGQKGTTVKLSIIRGTEAKDFTITRDQIVDPSVKSEVVAGDIGVMRISRFGQTDTARLARLAAEDFKSKNVRGVILDLRGNGGGYRDAAVEIAGLWMNDAVVMTERSKGKVTDTLKTGNNAVLRGVPTVVLIDGGSASASEILAGALKDNGAATLLGEKSFGKGSVQSIEDLPSGGVLKVTVARWYTPQGKNITHEGITPDDTVKMTDPAIQAGKDLQKDAAITKLQAGL